MSVDLAVFACDPDRSRGRLYPVAASAGRTTFQRDRDRIIHSNAFRRLKHKTQVFVAAYDDHFRTRLTHSLEVAQIARTLARRFRVNEDLTEALALSHDLGHTAFGHAGEDALDLCMRESNGFDHNAQAVRVVTQLEQRYASCDGINLSWEALEGLAKHNGPVNAPPWALALYNARHDLELDSYASVEAQIAAISDDIAYNAHDLDDGLRAGLFRVEDALMVPMVASEWAAVCDRYPDVDESRRIPELVRGLIGAMVEDVYWTTDQTLQQIRPRSVEEVRALPHGVVSFSAAMALQETALKTFLRTHMYEHEKVQQYTRAARQIVTDLFELLLGDPEHLPEEWTARLHTEQGGPARAVADFIAGMTDGFAIRQHEVLTGKRLFRF